MGRTSIEAPAVVLRPVNLSLPLGVVPRPTIPNRISAKLTGATDDPFYFITSNSIEDGDFHPRHPVARQCADETEVGRGYLAGLAPQDDPSLVRVRSTTR